MKNILIALGIAMGFVLGVILFGNLVNWIGNFLDNFFNFSAWDLIGVKLVITLFLIIFFVSLAGILGSKKRD